MWPVEVELAGQIPRLRFGEMNELDLVKTLLT